MALPLPAPNQFGPQHLPRLGHVLAPLRPALDAPRLRPLRPLRKHLRVGTVQQLGPQLRDRPHLAHGPQYPVPQARQAEFPRVAAQRPGDVALPGSNDGTGLPWNLAQIDRPSESIAIAESRKTGWSDVASWRWYGGTISYWDSVFAGHNQMFNVAFADGHVKLYRPSATTNPNLWFWTSSAPVPYITDGVARVTGNFP